MKFPHRVRNVEGNLELAVCGGDLIRDVDEPLAVWRFLATYKPTSSSSTFSI